MIKKLQHTALKNFWINKRLNSGRKLYFKEIFIPEFAESINKQLKLFRHFDFNSALEKTPVFGLLASVFQKEHSFFNSLDLAVALNIALNDGCNPQFKKNTSIANYVNFICEEFKNQISRDKILSEHLKELNKEMKDFNYLVDVEQLIGVLSNKTRMFKTYFKKFEDKTSKRRINIFQQSSSQAWVDWNPANSVSIQHNLLKFRRGFFLKGFDYQLDSGEELSLAANIGDYEYFNPSKYDRQKEIIWLSE